MHIARVPVEQVTSRNVDGEVDPREARMTERDVDAIWGSVVRLYETGLHPAVSLSLRRHGQLVIDRAIGHVRGNAPGAAASEPKRLVRHDSPFALFSASKVVTAMLIHLLEQRRLVRLDESVAEYIPEFAQHGKHAITLRQLLMHRAGIPSVSALTKRRIEAHMLMNHSFVLELLFKARLQSMPGKRVSYHALTSGFLFAEVIRRVTGKDLRTLLREEILAPLGFSNFDYGIAPERADEVAENALTGWPTVPPHSWLLERAIGVSAVRAVELSNHPSFMSALIPSCNLIASAEETARFFQLLLNGGEIDGVRVFEPRTIQRAVAAQSCLELDSSLGLPIRYGLGFMRGHRYFSPFGANTPSAFGHLGFTNVVVYADPDRALSVALLTSGKPFVALGQLAWLNVARTIARVCAPS